MAYGLTRRQAQILRYIAGYQEASSGVAPSFGEMSAGIGYSKGHVGGILNALVKRRLLRRLPKRDRAIEVLTPISIPRAPDGSPLYAVPGFGDAG